MVYCVSMLHLHMYMYSACAITGMMLTYEYLFSMQLTVEGDHAKEKRQNSESPGSPEAPSSTSRVPMLDLTALAPENNSSGKLLTVSMYTNTKVNIFTL